MAIKPMQRQIYGYLLVPEDADDNDVCRVERALRDFAERKGFSFVTTFYDSEPSLRPALGRLIEELKRSEARHVVMPSLHHLARHRLLRESRLATIEFEADAEMCELDSPGSTCSFAPRRRIRHRYPG
jgi:DNA invertase Pin-like site-specific DNA recombinase